MSNQMVHLRRVSPADSALLARWDRQPHLSDPEIMGDPDFNAEHWPEKLALDVDGLEMFVAEVDGRPIGFLQIIDPQTEESHYWGDCGPGLRAIDIWIGEPDAIGRGFGRQMMRQAIDRCFANTDVTAIVIDPMATNTAAHRFYEAMGFTLVGPRRFGPDDCIVYRLARQDWRTGA